MTIQSYLDFGFTQNTVFSLFLLNTVGYSQECRPIAHGILPKIGNYLGLCTHVPERALYKLSENQQILQLVYFQGDLLLKAFLSGHNF